MRNQNWSENQNYTFDHRFMNQPDIPTTIDRIQTQDIKLELTKLLYYQLMVSIPIITLLASILAWALIGAINPISLTIWYELFLIIVVLRGILAIWFYYDKRKEQLVDNYYILFIINSTLIAILWGAIGSMLMPANVTSQFFVIIMIAGVTAGATISLLPSYLAVFLYASISIIPLSIWTAMQSNTSLPHGLSIIMFTYWLFLVIISRRGHKSIAQNIRLSLENKALLKDVYESNDKLIAMNQQLQTINKTLDESERRFHQSFTYAAIGKALVSLDGQFMNVNKSFCNIVGYSEEELYKMNFQMITYPADLKADLEYVKQLIDGKCDSYHMEKRYICKNKEIVWILLTVTIVRDAQNMPLYFIAQIQDINKQKQMESQLVYQANHDLLTKLPNRHQLKEDIIKLAARANRYHEKFAILYIDLDGFKNINDNYGHDMGDSVLCEIAQRLQNCIRKVDPIARIGGDEFILTISEFSYYKEIEPLVLRILHILAEPITIGQHQFQISASIGISIYPDDGTDLDTLLKKADIALYKIKTSVKGNFGFYQDDYD